VHISENITRNKLSHTAGKKVSAMPDSNSASDGIDLNRNVFYAVARGKVPGIYMDWGLCNDQTNRISEALFKGLAEFNDNVQFMVAHSDLMECMIYMTDVYDIHDRRFTIRQYRASIAIPLHNNQSNDR
jgi:viroplasmin and RNaseH domain-containing protein